MAKNGPGAANRSHNAEQKHHTIMAANTGPKGGFPAGRPEAHAAYLQTSGVGALLEQMLAAVLVERPKARRESCKSEGGGGCVWRSRRNVVAGVHRF